MTILEYHFNEDFMAKIALSKILVTTPYTYNALETPHENLKAPQVTNDANSKTYSVEKKISLDITKIGQIFLPIFSH